MRRACTPARPTAIAFALALASGLLGCGSDPDTGGTGGTGGSATGGRGGSATGGSGGSATGGAGGSATGGAGGSATGGSGGSGSGGSGGAGGSRPADARGSDSARASDARTPDGAGGDTAAAANLPRFSFFVTSLSVMRRLSGSPNGFGGDLTFGKPDGLTGADEICRQAAEVGMAGAGQKAWRAFLSTTKGGPGGGPVNAIDRVGEGPWYDRLGRLVAMNKADLVQTRPRGAHPAIINDLPNENGVPNHRPDPGQGTVDNHHTMTGSDRDGTLFSMDPRSTCQDWTTRVPTAGRPRCGMSWPRGVQSWISNLDEAGCGSGINLVKGGGPVLSNPVVGSGGGYGGIYCFALTP